MAKEKKEKQPKLEIVLMDPAELIPYANNAKVHTDEKVLKIAGQISSFGFDQPIVVDKNKVIIKGHGRQLASIKLNLKQVPVVVATHLDDYQAMAARLADNEVAKGDVDSAKVAFDLGTLKRVNFDLQKTAFDLKSIDEMLETTEIKPEQIDERVAQIEEKKNEPQPVTDVKDKVELKEDEYDKEVPRRVKKGELWQLGRHLLLCGDSTSEADIKKLMQGKRAMCVLTDPPYNVGIQYGAETDDKMTPEKYAAWSKAWFSKCPSDLIVFTPGTVNIGMWYRLAEPHWMCVWRKANQCSSSKIGGFNTWEPLLVYGKPKKRVGHDSWDMPVKHADVNHPVAKTVKAWQTFVEAFSNEGDLLYEPFSGSGTTHIVCEQTKRTCYGIEISEKFCDVIVARWEKLTGEKAKKL